MSVASVRLLVAGASVVALAAGCVSVGPDYAPPEPASPAAWQRLEGRRIAVPGTEDVSKWWERLQDPVVSGLIESALAASPDLRSAEAKLREPRARRALAGDG